VGSTVTGDLVLSPRADLALGIDASTFSAQYAPSLVWREPQTGGRFLPLHQARLSFQHVRTHTTLLISQDAAYGIADLNFLRQPDGSLPASVGEVPQLGGLPYVRSATMGNLVSGSPEQSDAMPLQWGPTASLRARLAVTRIDGLTTLAQAYGARFVTGQEQFVAQLSELWDRQVSRTVTFNAGLGVGLTREQVTARQGIAGTYVDLLPIALASLSWRDVVAKNPLRFTASLRMAPFADRFTANVYERTELRLQGEWVPARDWVVTAATGGAVAVPVSLAITRPAQASSLDRSGMNQAGDRLLFAEGAVGWTVKTWLLIQASARVLWTDQPRLRTPSMVQAAGMLSVTVQQQDSLAW
jgi:hypothetical protein